MFVDKPSAQGEQYMNVYPCTSHLKITPDKRTAITDNRVRYRANRIHCQNDSAEISHPSEPTDHRCSFPKQMLIPHTEEEKHKRNELYKQSTNSSSKFDALAHGKWSEIHLKNTKTHSTSLRCGRVKGCLRWMCLEYKIKYCEITLMVFYSAIIYPVVIYPPSCCSKTLRHKRWGENNGKWWRFSFLG